MKKNRYILKETTKDCAVAVSIYYAVTMRGIDEQNHLTFGRVAFILTYKVTLFSAVVYIVFLRREFIVVEVKIK